MLPHRLRARSAPRRAIRWAAALAATVLLAGCAQPSGFSAADPRAKVVATTPVIADIARHVAGERAVVASLVPAGADPHAYEPTLRDVRAVAQADLALANGYLLEPHSVEKILAANLHPGADRIDLGTRAEQHGGKLLPLVENLTLDTIWLGIRVRGTGAARGATPASDVELRATRVDGPGRLVAYTTEALGSLRPFIDSDRMRPDAPGATLPPDAHSHMSWAFTAPGIYRLTLAASLRPARGEPSTPLGEQTYTFAVGVSPWGGAARPGDEVLSEGHADLSVDLDAGQLDIYGEDHGTASARRAYSAESTVIEVPNKAIQEIPPGPSFRLLGRQGDRLFQLPQAVLGNHVHGEIDPHLWQSVANGKAYALAIRDALVLRDPAGKDEYTANAARYAAELDALDAEIRAVIEALPQHRRHLVTTHDAFGYLADAYGLKVAGFVAPHPAVQPSIQGHRKLVETIGNLSVPAVFLEPNLASRSAELNAVARDAGVQVCPIYGDVFDSTTTSYAAMMRFNAESIVRCLDPEGTP